MKRFTIDRTESAFGSTSFTVRHDGQVAGWLCADEALGCIARIIYSNGRLNPDGERPDQIVWSMTVEEVSCGLWNITDRLGRFSGPMIDSECLYFIACLLMGIRLPFGGLESYVQKAAYQKWLRPKHVALLEFSK